MSGCLSVAVSSVAYCGDGVLTVPFGYIALDYDMSWLGILDAVRLDLFYMVFLAFCLVFVWEQAFIKVRSPPPKVPKGSVLSDTGIIAN